MMCSPKVQEELERLRLPFWSGSATRSASNASHVPDDATKLRHHDRTGLEKK